MFKDNFTRICTDKGLSPCAVCEAIGINKSNYSNWTNESTPRKTTLIKLSDYLGCTIEDLLADQSTPQIPQNSAHSVSDAEYEIILAMRQQPEMIPAVRRLLALPDENKKPADAGSFA